jgi:hypothetical protein
MQVMDTQRLAIHAEVAWIRARGWLRVGLRLAGLALVFLALFNMAGPLFSTHSAIAPYRVPIASALSLTAGAVYITDLIVLGVGLAVAWWG